MSLPLECPLYIQQAVAPQAESQTSSNSRSPSQGEEEKQGEVRHSQTSGYPTHLDLASLLAPTQDALPPQSYPYTPQLSFAPRHGAFDNAASFQQEQQLPVYDSWQGDWVSVLDFEYCKHPLRRIGDQHALPSLLQPVPPSSLMVDDGMKTQQHVSQSHSQSQSHPQSQPPSQSQAAAAQISQGLTHGSVHGVTQSGVREREGKSGGGAHAEARLTPSQYSYDAFAEQPREMLVRDSYRLASSNDTVYTQAHSNHYSHNSQHYSNPLGQYINIGHATHGHTTHEHSSNSHTTHGLLIPLSAPLPSHSSGVQDDAFQLALGQYRMQNRDTTTRQGQPSIALYKPLAVPRSAPPIVEQQQKHHRQPSASTSPLPSGNSVFTLCPEKSTDELGWMLERQTTRFQPPAMISGQLDFPLRPLMPGVLAVVHNEWLDQFKAPPDVGIERAAEWSATWPSSSVQPYKRFPTPSPTDESQHIRLLWQEMERRRILDINDTAQVQRLRQEAAAMLKSEVAAQRKQDGRSTSREQTADPSEEEVSARAELLWEQSMRSAVYAVGLLRQAEYCIALGHLGFMPLIHEQDGQEGQQGPEQGAVSQAAPTEAAPKAKKRTSTYFPVAAVASSSGPKRRVRSGGR